MFDFLLGTKRVKEAPHNNIMAENNKVKQRKFVGMLGGNNNDALMYLFVAKQTQY